MTGATQPPPVSQPELDRAVPECPYVGLVPFGESDAPYFFGRKRERDVVVANLTVSRLTLLYAASGVGKSSVLRAGVLPRLQEIARGSYAALRVPDAAVAYVREWSLDPLHTIATAVLDAVKQVPGADPVKVPDPPRLSVKWLRDVIQSSNVAAIYLVLDQFEEYFRYHPDDRGVDGLAGELGRILSTRDLPVNVLLSIREDALAALDRFKGRVPHLYDNYLRLAHLGRNAARAAIKGPLAHYNQVVPPDSAMTVQDELTETLLDDVRTGQVVVAPEGAAPDGAADGREDIETPYLQLVLTRLWEAERASGSSVLRHGTLAELGGAQKIVENHLRTVMAGLPHEQREVAAAVFHYLVTTSGSKKAQAAEDLAEWSDVPVDSVRELLQSLSAGRHSILRPVPSPAGSPGAICYEIFHDVIGTAVLDWRRQYVAQRAQAEASRRLSAEREEASRHLSAERAEREEAQAAEQAARRELDLIAEREKAREAAQATRRKLRKTQLVTGLTIMLLIVIVLCGYLYGIIRNAERQEYLAQAATALGHNPAQSLKDAVDAYQVNVPWTRDTNNVTRSAVLTAASSSRSHVVAEPDPKMIGMTSTPDPRHIVAYDAHGNIRVIDEKGDVLREAKASGLRGTVIPGAVAVSPDASRIALGTDQGTVAVINTETGEHVDIEIEGGLPRVVRWIGSAANGLVLVVSGTGAATTHNPETKKEIARFDGEFLDALPLADEQHIVTSGEDRKLRVWDARTGAKIAESPILSPNAYALRRYTQSVVSLSVVSLSTGANSSIVVWNWQAGRDPVRYPVDDVNSVRDIVVNDRARTITIVQEKRVRTYRLDDGSLLGSLPQQAGSVTSVAISPDGQWITTAGADGRVLVWPSSGSPTAPTHELLAFRGGAAQVDYLSAGKAVMGLGIDGSVQRWKLPEVPRFQQPAKRFVHMDLSHDRSWLAAASQDGHAFIIDPRDLSKPPVATVPAGAPLRVVLFEPKESHRILTLGRSDRVPKRWSWGGDGKFEQLSKYPTQLQAPEYLVSLAISPDGKTIAGGDTRGTIHLWDVATGELRTDPKFQGTGQPADSVTFDDRTGQLLAAAGRDGVRLWRLGTAEPPTSLSHPGATGVAFDPAGEHFVSTAGDGTVKIWTRDGEPVHDLVAHGHLSSSPSFSEDGELLAMGTAGGLVEVLDVRSRVTVMLDRHHSASVNNVVFLPGDRSQLISASDDTTISRFRCRACTDPDGMIRDAEEWAKTYR